MSHSDPVDNWGFNTTNNENRIIHNITISFNPENELEASNSSSTNGNGNGNPNPVVISRPLPLPSEPGNNSTTDTTGTSSGRANLALASYALDVAFSRLENIRSTLREMEANGHITRPQPSGLRDAVEEQVGPAHSAIVLEIDGRREMSGSTTLGTPEAPPSGDAVRLAQYFQGSLPGDHSQQAAVTQLIRRQITPSSAPQNTLDTTTNSLVRRRRSLLEFYLRQGNSRPESGDDASTSLGRRVAARESTSRNTRGSGENAGNSLDLTDTTSQFTSVVSRLSETLRGLDRQLYDHGLELNEGPSSGLPRDRTRFTPSVPTESIETRPPPSGESETATPRPSLIPGLVQDTEEMIPPSLLPRREYRPTRYRRPRDPPVSSQPQFMLQMNSDIERIEVEPEGRNYRIRRRLDANGEEVIHRIPSLYESLFEDFEPLEAPVPSRPLRHRSNSVTSALLSSRQHSGEASRNWPALPLPVPSRPSQPSTLDNLLDSRTGSSGRRRGWARLNADGDAITTDEEDQLERVRTERRMLERRNPLPDPTSTHRTRMEYLVPTTRPILSYGTDDEHTMGQVRLNLPSPGRQGSERRSYRYGASQTSEDDAESIAFGSSAPYYRDPLPIPLERMRSVDDPVETKEMKGFNIVPFGGDEAAR